MRFFFGAFHLVELGRAESLRAEFPAVELRDLQVRVVATPENGRVRCFLLPSVEELKEMKSRKTGEPKRSILNRTRVAQNVVLHQLRETGRHVYK